MCSSSEDTIRLPRVEVQAVRCGITPESSIYPRMQSFTVPAQSSDTSKFPIRDGFGPIFRERNEVSSDRKKQGGEAKLVPPSLKRSLYSIALRLTVCILPATPPLLSTMARVPVTGPKPVSGEINVT
jgi:hypothetical protein